MLQLSDGLESMNLNANAVDYYCLFYIKFCAGSQEPREGRERKELGKILDDQYYPLGGESGFFEVVRMGLNSIANVA